MSTTANHSPQIVYALTTNGRDDYAAMTYLSARTVRLTNAGASITLVCDADSSDALSGSRHPLVGIVDRVVKVGAPPGSPAFVSRYVKTSIRSHIDGQFLFVDSDVVVRKPLEEIFATTEDIAGACNHSRDTIRDQIWTEDREVVDRMQWQIRKDVYINSGVVFFNDSPGAFDFGQEWHRRWRLSFDALQSVRDQPAFNSALLKMSTSLRILPHRFNAQFRMCPAVARNAAIWHYYNMIRGEPDTIFEQMERRIMSGWIPDDSALAVLIGARHPWDSGSFPEAVRIELKMTMSKLGALFRRSPRFNGGGR
jgi:hypothetical protein